MSASNEFDGGQIAIFFLDIACILLIIGANVFVISLFLFQKKLRIASNYYIISLCGANLMAGCFGLPAEMMVFFYNEFQSLSCQTFQYFIHVIDCAEIYSLVLISHDRRRVVLSKQLQHHSTSMRRALAAISVTWLVSVLYGVRAPFLYTVDAYVVDSGTNITECGITHYGDHRDVLGAWFIALDFLFLFLAPLLVIVALYASLVHQLRKRSMPQQSQGRVPKVVQVVSSVVAVFFVCNIPTRILDIYVFLGPGVYVGEKITREICDLVKFASFGLNVIVYVLINDGFRSSARKYIASGICHKVKIHPAGLMKAGVSIIGQKGGEIRVATVTTNTQIGDNSYCEKY